MFMFMFYILKIFILHSSINDVIIMSTMSRWYCSRYSPIRAKECSDAVGVVCCCSVLSR